MSVKGCYTDFHVDFGGTSVWYHILKGSKVRIEPKCLLPFVLDFDVIRCEGALYSLRIRKSKYTVAVQYIRHYVLKLDGLGITE